METRCLALSDESSFVESFSASASVCVPVQIASLCYCFALSRHHFHILSLHGSPLASAQARSQYHAGTFLTLLLLDQGSLQEIRHRFHMILFFLKKQKNDNNFARLGIFWLAITVLLLLRVKTEEPWIYICLTESGFILFYYSAS